MRILENLAIGLLLCLVAVLDWAMGPWSEE